MHTFFDTYIQSLVRFVNHPVSASTVRCWLMLDCKKILIECHQHRIRIHQLPSNQIAWKFHMKFSSNLIGNILLSLIEWQSCVHSWTLNCEHVLQFLLTMLMTLRWDAHISIILWTRLKDYVCLSTEPLQWHVASSIFISQQVAFMKLARLFTLCNENTHEYMWPVQG